MPGKPCSLHTSGPLLGLLLITSITAMSGCSVKQMAIETLAVIAGKLPPRATGMVMEWATQHQDELLQAWEHAREMEPLGSTDPLR